MDFGRLRIAVSHGSIEALSPWHKDKSRVVVTTDASTRVRGAVFEGIPASWLWLEPQSQWHINRCLGAGSSFLSAKGFMAAAGTAACIDSHRQNVCGFFHKSPRPPCTRMYDPKLCTSTEQTLSLHQSSAHPQSPERLARYSLRKRDSSRRVEVAPWVGSDDLDPARDSGGGSVCHERECALPAVLHPVSLPAEGARSDIALASSQAVCVSSNQYISTGVMHDQE